MDTFDLDLLLSNTESKEAQAVAEPSEAPPWLLEALILSWVRLN